MSNLLQTIKENVNGMILLGLNLFMAIYRPNVLFYTFNPVPGPFPENPLNINPSNFALGCYLVTSGLLFIYLIFMFFPKLHLGRLLINCFILAIQILLITFLSILYFEVTTSPYFPLIYTIAGITLADRIFDIIVHSIASRKRKLQFIPEDKGSDIHVQV